MHQYPVVRIRLAGQTGQTIQYRMAAFRPADNGFQPFTGISILQIRPVAIPLGQRHDHTGKLSAGKQGIERVFQHRFLAQREVLFGDVCGHAPPGAGSR